MPRTYKSGKSFQGNQNSGRRPIREELKLYREKIKEETLEEIAEMRLHNVLSENDDVMITKDFALPIYLKSKADKKELAGNITLEITTYGGDKDTNSLQLDTGEAPTADIGESSEI